jgi:hypothetical protein
VTWHPKRILIVGKTYPVPSAKHIETVCTGGICSDGTWRRLHPVNFRYLDATQKYRNWDWIEVNVRRYEHDPRECSIEIEEESLAVIGHESKAAARWAWVRPLMVRSLEDLEKAHALDRHGITMAALEIVLDDFFWEPADPDDSAATLEKLNQELLFVRRKPLTVLPLHLRIRFHCARDPECQGHARSILAWDVQQAYLNWREVHGDQGALERLRTLAFERLDHRVRMPIALLSTLKNFPDTWCIGGFFYPRRSEIRIAQGMLW